MLCHFGQELHDQGGQELNNVLSHFEKLSMESYHAIESCIPFQQLFLQDYTGLEKLLVLINIVLFGASLNAGENLDPNVAVAIFYIMFTIAYFVVTSTCLTGATLLKACFGNQPILEAAAEECTKVTNKELKQAISDNAKSVGTTNSATVVNPSKISKKQQVGTKPNRKAALSSANTSATLMPESGKKAPTSIAAPTIPTSALRTRQKRNLC